MYRKSSQEIMKGMSNHQEQQRSQINPHHKAADAHANVPEDHQLQATDYSMTTSRVDEPAIDPNHDPALFPDSNYSNTHSVNAPVSPVQTKSAGAQRPRSKTPRTATLSRRSDSPARDIPLESATIAAMTDVPTHSFAVQQKMADKALGLQAPGRAGLQHRQNGNNPVGERVLNPHHQMPAPSRDSNTTSEAGLGGAESRHHGLPHDTRAGGRKTKQTHPPKPSRSNAQAREKTRPRGFENSIGNGQGGVENQNLASRRSQTPRTPSRNGADAPYAGSAHSSSSSPSEKCIMGDLSLASQLMKRIDTLLGDNVHLQSSDGLHEGVISILLMREVIQPFYNKYADGPANHPSDASLLFQIKSHKPPDSTIIVNAVDKIYTGAGWRLKSQSRQEVAQPILDANSSPSLPPPPKHKIHNRSSPPKRVKSSQNGASTSGKPLQQNIAPQSVASGTSTSGKRSQQNSTLQSFTSATFDTRTSVSGSSAAKEYPCHTCKIPRVYSSRRAWKKHYDTHFPASFWACQDCNFVANRSDSVNVHWDGAHSGIPDKAEYRIPDAGHECCIYCEMNFKGMDASFRKGHIIDHIQEGTIGSLNHRCTDPNDCGVPDQWWRNRIRRRDESEGEVDESQIDEEDGSSGPPGNDGHQGSRDSSSRGPGGGMGGGGERGGGRRGGREYPLPDNTFSPAPGRGYPGPENQDSDGQYKSPNGSTYQMANYVNDREVYIPGDGRTSTPPIIPSAVNDMGWSSANTPLDDPRTSVLYSQRTESRATVPVHVDHTGSPFEAASYPLELEHGLLVDE